MKKMYSINFIVNKNDIPSLENTFNDFKMYQQLNIIDKESTISYDGILIPCGYLEDTLQLLHVIRVIKLGTIFDVIYYDLIPGNLNKDEITSFLNLCNKESKKISGIVKDQDTIDYHIDVYLRKQKKVIVRR